MNVYAAVPLPPHPREVGDAGSRCWARPRGLDTVRRGDRQKGVFIEVQFESTHTDVMHCEGRASMDGKTITSYGTHVDAATGKRVRSVTTIAGGDAFTQELYYESDAPDHHADPQPDEDR